MITDTVDPSRIDVNRRWKEDPWSYLRYDDVYRNDLLFYAPTPWPTVTTRVFDDLTEIIGDETPIFWRVLQDCDKRFQYGFPSTYTLGDLGDGLFIASDAGDFVTSKAVIRVTGTAYTPSVQYILSIPMDSSMVFPNYRVLYEYLQSEDFESRLWEEINSRMHPYRHSACVDRDLRSYFDVTLYESPNIDEEIIHILGLIHRQRDDVSLEGVDYWTKG
jgi:hypothetical protein